MKRPVGRVGLAVIYIYVLRVFVRGRARGAFLDPIFLDQCSRITWLMPKCRATRPCTCGGSGEGACHSRTLQASTKFVHLFPFFPPSPDKKVLVSHYVFALHPRSRKAGQSIRLSHDPRFNLSLITSRFHNLTRKIRSLARSMPKTIYSMIKITSVLRNLSRAAQ